MAESKYQWDIVQLRRNIELLNKEKENLLNYKDFISRINSEIMNNWDSVSGSIYTSKLDVNIDVFNQLIQHVENQANNLEQALSHCYQSCEDEIKDHLVRLRSRL